MKDDNSELFKKDNKPIGGVEGTPTAYPIGIENNSLSRRVFIGHVGKIIALGALAHFKLLGSKAFAVVADQCCYGAAGDVCNPDAGYTDDCPGGGSVSVDNCTIADPPAQDECYTGIDPDDVCPSGGAPADGDACYGGGPKTGGAVQDRCDNGQGDACSSPGSSFPGGGGHDNCKANEEGNVADMCDDTNADYCNWVPGQYFSDDTCPSGNNVGFGRNGADDTCSGDIRSTDACYDGSATQDLCAGDPSGDLCMGMVGSSQTDECPNYKPPEDECPAGCSSSEDRCDPIATVPDV